MGKLKTLSTLRLNQADATAKFVRVPPRKARLVMDAVRGKYVTDALAVLKFVPNFAARAIEKVLKSAVANAENSRPYDAEGRPLPPLVSDNLKLVAGQINEGPRIKRIQPRAQGRAYRIVKRMCHIHVVVEEVAPKPSKPRRAAASRRARAAGRAATSPVTAARAGAKAPEPAAAPAEAAVAAEPNVVTTDVEQEAGAPVLAATAAQTEPTAEAADAASADASESGDDAAARAA
jgi:large subunit ribosomal protein L22